MNHERTNKLEYDECLAKGICSISPDLAYIHELIKQYIRELSFYLLKLEEIGITNEKIKQDLIEIISGLILNVNYSEENIIKIISGLQWDLSQTKEMYKIMYNRNNLKTSFIKSFFKSTQKTSLAEATRFGQTILNTINNNTTPEQRVFLELMYFVVKSICAHIVELKDLDVSIDEAYKVLLEMFNIRHSKKRNINKLKESINESVIFDHELLLKLQETREEKFGKITPTEISLSTRPNKAILVSGTNLVELEKLLEATKGKNIDIYTHGHMIMAHSYPKFKKYPHLVGHFGRGVETYLIDFAEFPGAIFLTRHSFFKVERLYRCCIFTTDTIAPQGVMIIKNDNYGPLIKAALSARGFTQIQENPSTTITLNQKEILETLEGISKKIRKGEIKHFFTIGISNHTKAQKDYFETFLSLLGNDSFALSFSYKNDKDNLLLVKSEYGFPLLYKSLELLTRNLDIAKLNPIICFTRCEIHTISNVLYLKTLGIKNIYFTDCSPTMANPLLIESMRKAFDINKYTTPEADYKKMINN